MLFSDVILILFAAGYGITMKIADLLNEHGLKWFGGSRLLFGILWGAFGAALVAGNDLVANFILAMNLGFLVRNRLDYLNHQLATSIIIVAFLLIAEFRPTFFAIFFLIAVIFGSLKDYLDDVLKRHDIIGKLAESGLYYPVPTLIYCLFYGQWVLFGVAASYVVSYNVTKLTARRYGYR